MDPLRFDDKVVLVTGAGNGLGKAYALAFGERGASVVVNDLGGDRTGSGASVRAADAVVNEIKAKGGKAVANYDSVEDGEKVVKTALDAFGRIDIVVNNAGILRDKSFARINNDDWDLIHRVHLRGSFMVTRAAWPHMKNNNYGRILMVSSTAGIYGNFGQANYSAAKLGLTGLSNTLAIEGRKYNIHCNTIAPSAGSRLTETVMPADLVAALKPEYVAPVVLYLCHNGCEETGSLFEIGAGWVGKLRWERTKGVALRTAKTNITPESVRDNWDKITDFTDSTRPKTIGESTALLVSLVTSADEEEKALAERQSSNMDIVSQAKAYKPDIDFVFNYTERDAMLYALGVGVSTTHPDYLKFLFELSEDFTVLPSFAVIPGFASLNLIGGLDIPGLDIDPTKILHGEQYTELFKPIPRSGTLTSKMSIADIVEKKSGLVIIANVETFDEEGEKVFFNQYVTFVVGAGPIGAQASSKEQVPLIDAPKRAPDASMTEKTTIDQAALYRLSGDYNPLHIDPAFAAIGGFKTPILHGLCSYGHAVRHVMAKYANNDMSRFKAVKVRFVKPVLPGQSLQTDMWKQGNRIHFVTKVVESGHVCISGAYVDLHEATAEPSQPETPTTSGLQSDAIFKTLQASLPSRTDLVKKVKAIFQWNILDNGSQAAQWTIDLKSGSQGQVYEGPVKQGKADCTITVSDADFVLMTQGKLNAQKAFMTGKLKLAGNMMIAQKLGDILTVSAKI